MDLDNAAHRRRLRIGTAGWSIPRVLAHRLPEEGTHLHRYAVRFPCAEINSSFHRPHTPTTYAKWAAATPEGFRFAVKVPRTITHDQRLRAPRRLLKRFLDEIAGLGDRQGPLLVQLPPSLAFEARVASRFFHVCRELWDGAIVCEPRHATWLSQAAEALLVRARVARVAADPPRAPNADRPGGWPGLRYYRLHGSPRTYWSSYDAEWIARLAGTLLRAAADADVWCIFDNTASGAALDNAFTLMAALSAPSRQLLLS